jgi:hypothetical protein
MRVVAFGLLLFVFGCEGTWLDCFSWAGDDMECVPGGTQSQTRVVAVIASWAAETT